MANELTVLTPPAKVISADDGVITAESPMTQDEFELLNKLLIQIRTGVSDRDWVPNYYENIANQMLAHTHSAHCAGKEYRYSACQDGSCWP